jgi:hypothetical protein
MTTVTIEQAQRDLSRLIEDQGNAKFVSAASLWEMGIKISLARLSLAQPFEELIPREIAGTGSCCFPCGSSTSPGSPSCLFVIAIHSTVCLSPSASWKTWQLSASMPDSTNTRSIASGDAVAAAKEHEAARPGVAETSPCAAPSEHCESRGAAGGRPA